MYNKLYAIDTSKHNSAQTFRFIDTFARIIYPGRGQKTNLGETLKLNETDGMRVLLGVPESWLTDSRQAVIESVWCYAVGAPLRPRRNIWTDEPTWDVVNPNATDALFNPGTMLDTEFIASFGLRSGLWEEIMYVRDITAKTLRADVSEDMLMRAYVGLAAFGFRDPLQFFTTPRRGR